MTTQRHHGRLLDGKEIRKPKKKRDSTSMSGLGEMRASPHNTSLVISRFSTSDLGGGGHTFGGTSPMRFIHPSSCLMSSSPNAVTIQRVLLMVAEPRVRAQRQRLPCKTLEATCRAHSMQPANHAAPQRLRGISLLHKRLYDVTTKGRSVTCFQEKDFGDTLQSTLAWLVRLALSSRQGAWASLQAYPANH